MSSPDPGTGPLPGNAPECPLCGRPDNCALGFDVAGVSRES